jgi:hypothetical protein
MHARDLGRSDGPTPRHSAPAPEHDAPARRPAAGGIAPINGRTVAYLQRTAGNHAVNGLVALQRQPPAQAPAPAKPATTAPLVYVVVRDRNLDAGGGSYADNLEQAKQIFMRNSNTQPWTLVLSIHGSEQKLGAQAPPNWQDNAKFYESAAIESLFNGDPEYVKWRAQFGPTHIVLNACQINIGFERTIINNITRPGGTGSQQGAQGLGTGCKPLTTTKTVSYTHDQLGFKDTPIKTRAQWNKIPADDQGMLEQELAKLNTEFGYFGQPPVPAGDVVRYYFDVTPLGGWPVVEVGVGHDTVQPTGIPFWNRSTGPKRLEFNQLCERGIGKLPDRTPSAPP